MATLPASPNANIQATTRELWIRSVVEEVFRRMPLTARLLMKRKVTVVGGKVLTRPVDKDEIDSLAQDYDPVGDPLTAGRKTFMENPYFVWKYFQLPVVYDAVEYIQNGGGADIQVVDFVRYLVKKAQRGTLIKLYKLMYEAAGLTTDAGKPVQGIRSALTHDRTYGHLTRTIGTSINTWWQGASIAETWADQGVPYSCSIDTFRKALAACQSYVHDPADYLGITGPANYQTLKSWVESKHVYTQPGPLAKYGFNSFTIDNVEVVEDPFLKNSVITGSHLWFFMLNTSTWELRMHPERAMKMTPFTWQGDKVNGLDQWLARVLFTGNLVCWAPNANLYLSNVS